MEQEEKTGGGGMLLPINTLWQKMEHRKEATHKKHEHSSPLIGYLEHKKPKEGKYGFTFL
jgi:hypothetical protein